jgi:hypothetical protein
VKGFREVLVFWPHKPKRKQATVIAAPVLFYSPNPPKFMFLPAPPRPLPAWLSVGDDRVQDLKAKHPCLELEVALSSLGLSCMAAAVGKKSAGGLDLQHDVGGQDLRPPPLSPAPAF